VRQLLQVRDGRRHLWELRTRIMKDEIQARYGGFFVVSQKQPGALAISPSTCYRVAR
jgi:hypothetical protein